MNCNDIQKFSFTYLDCEFDARERGEFETHLRLCAPCRHAVERDALFRNMIRDHLATGCPDAGLRARLANRLDCAQRQRVSRRLAVPLALAASTAAVMVAWQLLPMDPGSAMLLEGGMLTAQAAAPMALSLSPRPAPAPQVVAQPAPIAPPEAPRVAAAKARRAHEDEVAAERTLQALRAQAATLARIQPAPQPPALAQAPGGAAFQLASAVVPAEPDLPVAEVLRGALDPRALAERSPFGAVRSESSLRAMVRLHAAALPPEVTGSATRIQKYLAARVPGVGPLPLSEGDGVDLVGARLTVIGPQPVVVYSYVAWGVPVTVVSRPRCRHNLEDAEVEAAAPDARVAAGMLLDRRTGVSLLHVVTQDRVLTLASELGAPALLQLAPDAL